MLPIEEGYYERLLPLRPHERYRTMTERPKARVLMAKEGDSVFYLDKEGGETDGWEDIGLIRYIGPVDGLGKGVFYGVELMVRSFESKRTAVIHCSIKYCPTFISFHLLP